MVRSREVYVDDEVSMILLNGTIERDRESQRTEESVTLGPFRLAFLDSFNIELA